MAGRRRGASALVTLALLAACVGPPGGKGEPGPSGPPGPRGPTGPTGPAGRTLADGLIDVTFTSTVTLVLGPPIDTRYRAAVGPPWILRPAVFSAPVEVARIQDVPSVGVTFPATAGVVRACAAFDLYVGLSARARGRVTAVFQIAETPETSEDVIQEGSEHAAVSFEKPLETPAGYGQTTPVRVCSSFRFDHDGRRTLRLLTRTELDPAAESSGPGMFAPALFFRNTHVLDGDVHFEVLPL